MGQLKRIVRYVHYTFPPFVSEHVERFIRGAWQAGRRAGMSSGLVGAHIKDVLDRSLYLLDLALGDASIPLPWVRGVLSVARYAGSFAQRLAHFRHVVALAAYGPYEKDLRMLRDLVFKALKRNDTLSVGYLAAIFSHAREEYGEPLHVLRALENQLVEALGAEGRRVVPRHGVSKWVSKLALAYAATMLTGAPENAIPKLQSGIENWLRAHGLSGDVDLSVLHRVPGTVLTAALSLYGITSHRYLRWVRAVAAGAEREFLKNMLGEGIHRYFDSRYTIPMPAGPVTFHVSKYSILPVLESFEKFPSCFNPALGDRGHPFVFGGEHRGVVPLIIVATREGRPVGRISTIWDANSGKIYVTSEPFGRVGKEKYFEVIAAHARSVNDHLGERVFREIWSGPGPFAAALIYPVRGGKPLYDDYALPGHLLGGGKKVTAVFAQKVREI